MVVSFRVSEQEYILIKSAAAREGSSISNLVRVIVLSDLENKSAANDIKPKIVKK